MAETRELFGRKPVKQIRPVTADMAVIVWSPHSTTSSDASGGTLPTDDKDTLLTGATNINISYQQQVIRRRTLGSSGGSPVAVMYPTQPIGSMSIQRLFADPGEELGQIGATGKSFTGPTKIFDYPGWNTCRGTAKLQVTFNGDSAYEDCAVRFGGFVISGAVVTGYNISAEAEGLTVVDNVNIEFLQLSRIV